MIVILKPCTPYSRAKGGLNTSLSPFLKLYDEDAGRLMEDAAYSDFTGAGKDDTVGPYDIDDGELFSATIFITPLTITAFPMCQTRKF